MKKKLLLLTSGFIVGLMVLAFQMKPVQEDTKLFQMKEVTVLSSTEQSEMVPDFENNKYVSKYTYQVEVSDGDNTYTITTLNKPEVGSKSVMYQTGDELYLIKGM